MDKTSGSMMDLDWMCTQMPVLLLWTQLTRTGLLGCFGWLLAYFDFAQRKLTDGL